jgi:hypothetical protein
MKYFLIILFMLSGLAAHCFAAEEQPADSGDSTTQPAAPAPEDGKDEKKPAEEEAEPDCE